MVCSCLSFTYHFNIIRILLIEDINNSYSTATHYAKCDVISRQNKQLKLKYLINKIFERKSIKELVLQFKYTFLSCNKNFRFIGISKSELFLF